MESTLPSAVPPLLVLPEIVRVVGGRIPVFVDCGVMNGMDVFKALALGATAVSVGRPVMNAVLENGASILPVGVVSTTGGYAATIDSLLPEIESCRAICIAHSGKPLPSSFARVFKEVLENIKAEDCRPLPVEGTPEPLLIYRKKTEGYSFGIFLFGSQIKQKAADSPSEH